MAWDMALNLIQLCNTDSGAGGRGGGGGNSHILARWVSAAQ